MRRKRTGGGGEEKGGTEIKQPHLEGWGIMLVLGVMDTSRNPEIVETMGFQCFP